MYLIRVFFFVFFFCYFIKRVIASSITTLLLYQACDSIFYHNPTWLQKWACPFPKSAPHTKIKENQLLCHPFYTLYCRAGARI